jgi:sulfite dehydrogenase (quinone) subunit SoeC
MLALVLTGLGLVASFFHLGRPERAWRTAAMWRTSWLSREVIALPLFMGGVASMVAQRWAGGHARAIGIVLTALACAALFVCTAMIYASIRSCRNGPAPLTLINYTLLGCASGFTLATCAGGLRRRRWVPGRWRPRAAFTVAAC